MTDITVTLTDQAQAALRQVCHAALQKDGLNCLPATSILLALVEQAQRIRPARNVQQIKAGSDTSVPAVNGGGVSDEQNASRSN